MFEQLISTQAAARPQAVAMRIGEANFSYATMDADIRRCASKLQALPVRSGNRVALAFSNPYLHWVFAFACEALGATTLALPEPPRNQAAMRFVGADLVITDGTPTPDLSQPTLVIDRAWTEALRKLAPAPLPPRARSESDPVIIVLSSGTTGTPKKVLLTRGMLDLRLEQGERTEAYVRAKARIDNEADGADAERRLTPIHVASVATLMLALLTWKLGGSTCVREPNVGWADALLRSKISLFVAAPSQVQAVCDELPPDATPMRDLQLLVVGGSLSKSLASDVRKRLTPDISIAYGTTETNYITAGHLDLLEGAEDSAGYVDPWMEVQVIRSDGSPAAPGETGEIRVRGPSVISGYLEQEGDPRTYFRDGWYHPGDLGAFDDEGVLRVLGRTDDLMNFSGAKVLPSRIETLVLGCGPISEAAAFAVSEDGQSSLCVAFIAEAKVDLAAVKAQIAKEDAAFARGLRLFQVERLPRNGLGKIERLKLRASVTAGELQTA